jgi:hypothetical protein
MRTFGIDLSSQPSKTAACLLEWTPGSVKLVELDIGLTDDDIAGLATGCEKIGIDAPFGWPVPFIDFLNRGDPEGAHWTSKHRETLCLRLTDLRVHKDVGIPPLAVTADKIAITAMRCSGLLHRSWCARPFWRWKRCRGISCSSTESLGLSS